MLISDYINFIVDFLFEGVIFIDLIDLYVKCLCDIVCSIDLSFDEGVYM